MRVEGGRAGGQNGSLHPGSGSSALGVLRAGVECLFVFCLSCAFCVLGDLLILLSGELFSDYNVTFEAKPRDCQRNSCVTVTSYSGAKNRHLARMLSELLKCIFDWDPFFPGKMF